MLEVVNGLDQVWSGMWSGEKRKEWDKFVAECKKESVWFMVGKNHDFLISFDLY